MTEKVKVPIIIGVGEVKNPSRRKEDAIEPLDLMLSSIQNAAQDAVAKPTDLISQINGVSVVASSTWPYQNLPEIISQRLGVKPSHMAYSELTGNSSVQKIDDTAQQIARGDIDVGLVVGGEAFASC